MGNIKSQNTIDSAISANAEISSKTSLDCSASSVQIQKIAYDGSKCINVTCPDKKSAVIDLSGNTFNSSSSVKVDCKQTAVQDSDITNKIAQQATQTATSVSQALSLNPGSTEANNTTIMSTAVGVQIANEVSEILSAPSLINQSIQIDNMCCGTIISKNNQFNAINKVVLKGTQDSLQKSKVANDLSTSIKQTAAAKQEALFSFGFVFIIIIAIIAMGSKFTPTSIAKKIALGPLNGVKFVADQAASLSSSSD